MLCRASHRSLSPQAILGHEQIRVQQQRQQDTKAQPRVANSGLRVAAPRGRIEFQIFARNGHTFDFGQDGQFIDGTGDRSNRDLRFTDLSFNGQCTFFFNQLLDTYQI